MKSRIAELSEEFREDVSRRLVDLKQHVGRQDAAVRQLFAAFEKEMLADADDTEEPLLAALYLDLADSAVSRMDDMMSGPIGRFVRYIYSDHYYEMFRAFLQREELCALSVYGMVVPSGGRRPLLHVDDIAWAITDFFVLDALGWDDGRMLLSCEIEESEDEEQWILPATADIIEEWLTVKLASGDPSVTAFIADALDEQYFSDVVCRLYFSSILKSGHPTLLQLAVNLLLHQEDYYDTLAEDVFNSYTGMSPESMLFLLDRANEDRALKDIIGPMLLRILFPKGDIGLGHVSDDELLVMAADCLRYPDLRQQWLTADVPDQVYLALWATGFYDADVAWDAANQLIKSGRLPDTDVVLTYYQCHWAKQSYEVISERILRQAISSIP